MAFPSTISLESGAGPIGRRLGGRGTDQRSELGGDDRRGREPARLLLAHRAGLRPTSRRGSPRGRAAAPRSRRLNSDRRSRSASGRCGRPPRSRSRHPPSRIPSSIRRWRDSRALRSAPVPRRSDPQSTRRGQTHRVRRQRVRESQAACWCRTAATGRCRRLRGPGVRLTVARKAAAGLGGGTAAAAEDDGIFRR